MYCNNILYDVNMHNKFLVYRKIYEIDIYRMQYTRFIIRILNILKRLRNFRISIAFCTNTHTFIM